MVWVFHKPLKRKEFNIQQVQRLKKIGIKLIVKLKETFSNMVNNLVLIQEWPSSNKFLRMLIQTKEELWWKVSKLQEEQFYQLIGMMSQRKTTKEKTDHLHQKGKNGKRENFDFSQKSLILILYFENGI